MATDTNENVDPQYDMCASRGLWNPEPHRALRTLGPGLRRRDDNTVTPAEYASDEDFDLYFDPGEEDQDEQDLTGFETINRCVVCKVDMGYCNPRQLCCKTYCPHDGVETEGEDEDARCDTVVRTRLIARENFVVLDLTTVESAIQKDLRF